MLRPPRSRRLLVLVIAVCGVAPVACTADKTPPRASSSPVATPSTTICPAQYAAPDPDRPRVTLRFSLDPARRTVTGSETVVFTPDRPVRELVFRLWPNSPTAVPGTNLTVSRVEAGTATRFTVEPAGAADKAHGTLLRIPLGREVPAGESVTAVLDFTLTLGGRAFERWGTSGKTAWWGTGHPLLAWVRGAGWQTDPASPVLGEYAVSEVARYDITVDAPAADEVLMTGVPESPVAAGPGRRRWHAINLTARDISVAVGTFSRREGVVDGTPVVVAASSDTPTDLTALYAHTTRSVRDLNRLLGPFPYPNLTVVALPSFGARGIEYPGGFFVGPTLAPVTITHEAAHEWFYGLVGDNQARDPWLDEAFATYAEAVVNGRESEFQGALARKERVDTRTSAFTADPSAYPAVVYGKGAAALLSARQATGAPAFDAAVRCYVNANAWQVASPAEVAAAFADLPRARAALRSAGALR